MNDLYTIIPKASIRPNQIVFYNRFEKNLHNLENSKYSAKYISEIENLTTTTDNIKQPKSNKHNFEISFKASKRIKEKVTWLYHLAKTRTITTHNNKVLYSFKMNFITLTLPSEQKHQTSEIISKCLNQFFVECSQRFNMVNYVWRLEYQKNGNAHFHIATDTFVEFWQARTIWNRCLNKLGYINDYTTKNIGKTFNEYLKNNPITEINTFEKLRTRFTYGCASGWTNPNTIDVRCVTNSKNISFYISKYITKKSTEKLNPIVAARENTNSNIRLWFCSRSLSKVDKIDIFLDSCSDNLKNVFSTLQQVKYIIHDYCEVMYFNIKEQTNEWKRLFREILFEYAADVGYFNRATQ